MCNLLSVFIMQLRSHIWWGWYQQGILGSHASIMAPVKLEHYKASVINPCDQYPPPPPTLIYEWQNLTRGQLRWVAADHMIPALKSQVKNVDRTAPPPTSTQKNQKTLMPHITTNTLSVPSFLKPSYVQWCRGEERVLQSRWGGGGEGGTQIVAAFDLKVASPLLVLRDPWRTRLALI